MIVSTVVITGGAGFLGSHLCEMFVARGDNVVVVDNLSTGSIDNIAPLLGAGVEFIAHDATVPMNVPGEVDAVLHFASPASPKDYLQMPIETLQVGSVGTQNALDLASANDARFLLASTSEVYGDPQVHPQPETYWGHVSPTGPRGVYDEAKRFAEAMTLAYHRYHGLDVRIARIFNTYGPRMRPEDGRVVSNFIRQALAGEPLTVYGAGDQTRSFGYVTDTASGLIALLDSEYVGPVNIGNPGEFTVLELAEHVLRFTGSDSKIIHEPLPIDDPTRRRPDITLAREVLGWEPQVSLADGIANTVAWFQSLVTATVAA
ncbi:MAG: SDR family oxidoreductase [Actinobacteria bacterium]|nr:SDR family oxidoreductase [Actinomycetota bacterium]MCB9389558.1 SDR family oxidoreductase [Acidimicrobiia bacterium]